MSDCGRMVNSMDGSPRGNIYEGDLTSHGGVVLTVSGHHKKQDGKRNARLGDITYCPKCKPHHFPITTADDRISDHGVAVPRQGDATACGAVLLSVPAPWQMAAAAEAVVRAEASPFNEQIQVIDPATSAPLPNIAYFIESADGITFFGDTDSDGKCPRIGSSTPLRLKAWFGVAALAKKFGGG